MFILVTERYESKFHLVNCDPAYFMLQFIHALTVYQVLFNRCSVSRKFSTLATVVKIDIVTISSLQYNCTHT